MIAFILAGCGGSGAAKEQWVRVSGNGFRFEAPAGWKVLRGPMKTAAVRDSELVQVATFALIKPYTDALFDRVARELTVRMRVVAGQSGGRVSGISEVTVDGTRSHAYDVSVGDHVDQYTFVLRGKREYQLLCRRKTSSSVDVCRQLRAGFSSY